MAVELPAERLAILAQYSTSPVAGFLADGLRARPEPVTVHAVEVASLLHIYRVRLERAPSPDGLEEFVDALEKLVIPEVGIAAHRALDRVFVMVLAPAPERLIAGLVVEAPAPRPDPVATAPPDRPWVEVTDHDRPRWDGVFGLSLAHLDLEDPCPVCGVVALHRWYWRQAGVVSAPGRERGSSWQWCSACRSYVYATGPVPHWWVDELIVPPLRMTHDPQPLEEALHQQP